MNEETNDERVMREARELLGDVPPPPVRRTDPATPRCGCCSKPATYHMAVRRIATAAPNILYTRDDHRLSEGMTPIAEPLGPVHVQGRGIVEGL